MTTSAFINATASGSTDVVAAQTGKRYVIQSVCVITTDSNTVKFLADATDISPAAPLLSGGGFVLPFQYDGWFSTSVGQKLAFNMAAATPCAVMVTYRTLNY